MPWDAGVPLELIQSNLSRAGVIIGVIDARTNSRAKRLVACKTSPLCLTHLECPSVPHAGYFDFAFGAISASPSLQI
jgi:hypothetical protein